MKRKIGIILGMALIASSVTAFAASYGSYNTTVGRMAGYGYTGTLKQVINGASPSIDSNNVGANYLVDVRAQDRTSGSTGSWTIDLGDNTFCYISATSKFAPNDNVRLQFQNKPTTSVDVQVDGDWATN